MFLARWDRLGFVPFCLQTRNTALNSKYAWKCRPGACKADPLIEIVHVPWAQEIRGSNPRAPTTYFSVFNLLCLTWSASEPELGSIWVRSLGSATIQADYRAGTRPSGRS